MEYINGNELAGKKFIKLENGDFREVKEKFIPKNGKYYYFLSAGGVVCCNSWSQHPIDHWRAKHTLLFATHKECEEYKHFLEVLDKYTFEPDWNDFDRAKWYIFYDHREKNIEFGCVIVCQIKNHYFKSEDQAKSFVNEVGEAAVKRFMFDVWE